MSLDRLPLIVMMQPTHFWDFPDPSMLRSLNRPRYRRIHLQRPVRAPMLVILDVTGQEPPPMSLMQDHHVVQACAADTPDQPCNLGVLPRTPRGDHDVFDAHVLHPLPKRGAGGAVPIAREIPWGVVPREGLDGLLCGPRRGGVFRDGEVDNATSMMGQEDEDKKHRARHRGPDPAIQSDQILDVGFQTGVPRR